MQKHGERVGLSLYIYIYICIYISLIIYIYIYVILYYIFHFLETQMMVGTTKLHMDTCALVRKCKTKAFEVFPWISGAYLALLAA